MYTLDSVIFIFLSEFSKNNVLVLQLNEYETAPYLIQFSQNLTCDCLCFAPNLPELNLKLFCSDVQNNFWLSSGKFGAKHSNHQTITFQVLAELNKV